MPTNHHVNGVVPDDHAAAACPKPLPVYVLPQVPGAVDSGAVVREWLDIVGHSHIAIRHQGYRSTSRWGAVERKRPYLVESWHRRKSGGTSTEIGASATLAGALKIAKSAA